MYFFFSLLKFFTKRKLKPIRELIDGTIHCKPGAAEIFVQDIYTMLTDSRYVLSMLYLKVVC